MLVFIATGCGNSKGPEETFKTINNYTDKIMVSFGNYYDDYRGLDDKCYNHDGIEKECGRIVSEPNDKYSLIIMNGKEELYAYIENEEVLSLAYNNDEGGYTHNYKDNRTYSFLKDNDYCSYYFTGNSDDDSNICDPSNEEKAEKIKKDYEKMLSDIGITENELKSFVSWYAKDEGKKLLSNIKNEKAEQQSLTPDDVKQILSSNYNFTKIDEGVYVEDKNGYETMLFSHSEEVNAIIYESILYEDLTLYIYEDGEYLASTKDDKCNYSLNNEKILKDSDCSSNEVDDSILMNINFEKLLDENKITLEELFNFFVSYK